jgi:predicted ATP-dependent protease
MFKFNNKKELLLSLQEQNEELSSRLQQLNEECANYKRTISSFVGVKTGYENDLTNLKKAHAKELNSLKEEIQAENLSVAKRVNKALADIGVKEFASEEVSDNTNTEKSVYDKFMSLSGAEKTEFFQKNEATLTRMLGFKKLV